MVDGDFIKKMIDGKENNRFDRKLKITSKIKIAKTISAFANTDGGVILIGVTDSKKIIGVDPEEEKFMINTANEHFCIPSAAIEFSEYIKVDFNEETKVVKEVILLLVIIEKSQNELIYAIDSAKVKKAYHRVNDQSLAL